MFGKKTKCQLLDTFVRSSSLKIEDTMPTFQSVGNFRVLLMLLNRFSSDAEITSQVSLNKIGGTVSQPRLLFGMRFFNSDVISASLVKLNFSVQLPPGCSKMFLKNHFTPRCFVAFSLSFKML